MVEIIKFVHAIFLILAYKKIQRVFYDKSDSALSCNIIYTDKKLHNYGITQPRVFYLGERLTKSAW